jgi:hypothetical protein
MTLTLTMFIFLLAMGLGAAALTAYLQLPEWLCHISGIVTISILLLAFS